MYRTAGLAVLLCISNVIADKINLVDDNLALVTAAITSHTARPNLNLAQVTSGIARTENNPQSTVGVALTSTALSATPSASINHTATLDLSTSFQNKTFLPFEIDGHEVPVSCLNCSTSGTLQVSGTELSLNTDLIGSDDSSPFDGGVFAAVLPHGLKGRIELSLSAPSTLSHTFNLSKVPITGFAIPGVADAGVTVDIGVQFSLQLTKPSDVLFGFEFEVPEHSSILIDVANEKNSTVHGFGSGKDLKFNILPVKLGDPSLDVKVSAALILSLVIGADIHDNDIVADIGARLAVPIMVEERQLSHVDGQCNPLRHKTSTSLITQSKSTVTTTSNLAPRQEFRSLPANYTNIIPVAGMEMSVFVAAGLQGSLGGHDLGFNTGFPLFHTAFMLPTTCINNHKMTSAPATSTTGNAGMTATQQSGGETQTDHLPASSTNATSAAAGSLTHGESGEAFLFMGSSTALALAIAMGWLVVTF